MAVVTSGPYVYPATLGGAAFSVGDALSIAQVQQAALDLNHIMRYRRPVLASGCSTDDYGDESAVTHVYTEPDGTPDTITANIPFMGPRATVLLHRPFNGLQFYFRARTTIGFENTLLYYGLHSGDLDTDTPYIDEPNVGFLEQGNITIANTTPSWYAITMCPINGIPDTRILRFTTQSLNSEDIKIGPWIITAYMA